MKKGPPPTRAKPKKPPETAKKPEKPPETTKKPEKPPETAKKPEKLPETVKKPILPPGAVPLLPSVLAEGKKVGNIDSCLICLHNLQVFSWYLQCPRNRLPKVSAYCGV